MAGINIAMDKLFEEPRSEYSAIRTDDSSLGSNSHAMHRLYTIKLNQGITVRFV